MMTISDLSTTLGITTRQAYTRIAAVSTQFPEIVQIGKNNQKLIGDQGLALLRRLAEFERQGMTTQAAVERLKAEYGNINQNSGNGSSKPSGNGGNVDGNDRLYGEMKERIQYLERENIWLRGQLESKESQLNTILPMLPSTTESKPSWWTWLIGR
jgi:hypothetical protein